MSPEHKKTHLKSRKAHSNAAWQKILGHSVECTQLS